MVERFSSGAGASLHPNPVMVCSLTRAAASEVAGRDLPIQKSAVGTLHAHCFRALQFPKIIGKADIEIWNTTSSYPLGASDFGGDDDTGEETSWDRRADVNIETDGDALLQRMEILRHKMTDKSLWDVEVLNFAEEWDQFKMANNVMDFTDLIEVALLTIDVAPGNPAVVMVDEAQDMSALEYSLIKSWSDKARASIIVGDPWQALYTWRGADPSLFSDPSVPATHRRILSQSYRVPANVLKVAVGWVADHLSTYEPIEYAPRKRPIVDDSDIPGACGWRESTINENDQLIDEAVELIESGRTVMFQTTCSYMLNSIVGNLRRKNIPFANPWRKWRRDWNPLGSSGGVSMVSRMLAFVKNCSDHPNRSVWTVKDVARFVDPMQAKGTLNRGAKTKISGLGDEPSDAEQADDDLFDHPGVFGPDPSGQITADEPLTIEERNASPVSEEDLEEWFDPYVLADVARAWSGQMTVKEAVLWWHDHLLGAPKKVAEYGMGVLIRYGVEGLKESPKVYVGTIHSFKGAEANTTFIFPDLSAAGFRQWTSGSGEPRDEVVRLFYVALTRAIEQAFVCGPSSKMCAPLRRYVQKFED